MSQQINDNFDVLAGLPIERKYRQETIAGRDNIQSVSRYTGMQCYVEQTGVLYVLIGGIDNSNWTAVNGAAGGVATYQVEGYPFLWRKGRSDLGVLNEENIMEQGDIIMYGYCNYDDGSGLTNTFIKQAEYNSGDTTFISSYNVIEYI